MANPDGPGIGDRSAIPPWGSEASVAPVVADDVFAMAPAGRVARMRLQLRSQVDGAARRPVATGALSAALLLLIGVGWWLGRPPSVEDPVALIPMIDPPATLGSAIAPSSSPMGTGSSDDLGPSPGREQPPGDEQADAVLVVHVAGAVARPGVVEVAAGARIVDAVTAAGGPTEAATVHRLNLAAPVADGMQIVVPTADDEVTHPAGLAPPPPGGAGGGAAAAETDRPIDLNTAGEDELQRLRGVGPARAAAIVDWRERNGPFISVDQLLEVPGIGPATLDGLADDVRIGP
ncbi:MAG: ComEA family DNA-binding protein [Actinomycetota bacterium]